MKHIPHFFIFFLDKDTSRDQNTRYVYKVAYWIQESCRSFVLIHLDVTISSIPFEKLRTGILWNHRRSQETMYYMSLKFCCFIHLLAGFFMLTSSSCCLFCFCSYRTMIWNQKSAKVQDKAEFSAFIPVTHDSKSYETFFDACVWQSLSKISSVYMTTLTTLFLYYSSVFAASSAASMAPH